MNEERVELIEDGFEASSLAERDKLILAYTDLFLHNPGGIDDDIKARMQNNFSDAQIVELTAGLALFMGFSKIAISSAISARRLLNSSFSSKARSKFSSLNIKSFSRFEMVAFKSAISPLSASSLALLTILSSSRELFAVPWLLLTAKG